MFNFGPWGRRKQAAQLNSNANSKNLHTCHVTRQNYYLFYQGCRTRNVDAIGFAL